VAAVCPGDDERARPGDVRDPLRVGREVAARAEEVAGEAGRDAVLALAGRRLQEEPDTRVLVPVERALAREQDVGAVPRPGERAVAPRARVSRRRWAPFTSVTKTSLLFVPETASRATRRPFGEQTGLSARATMIFPPLPSSRTVLTLPKSSKTSVRSPAVKQTFPTAPVDASARRSVPSAPTVDTTSLVVAAVLRFVSYATVRPSRDHAG
jgi:hypothetical protein